MNKNLKTTPNSTPPKFAKVRADLLKSKESVPVGDHYYNESEPLPYRWIEGSFYIFHNEGWHPAYSIDWDFED